MKTNMTAEQISQAVQSNAPGARQYFDDICAWISKTRRTLPQVYKDFVADTGSNLDYGTFTSQMFHETHAGKAAAARLQTAMRA